MKNHIIISLAFIAILSSCSKGIDNLSTNQIQFYGSIDTKSTGSNFEIGDNVSLWAVEQINDEKIPLQLGGNYINNESLTYDGASFLPQQSLFWSDYPCDFIAVYPFRNEVTSIDKQLYSLPTEQDTDLGDGQLSEFEKADILYARVDNMVRRNGPVYLQFNHILSKCTVKIIKGDRFEGEIPDDIVVHIYNTNIEYILDLNKGTAAKYALGKRQTITMKKNSNDSFEAVVVPQNIELSTPLIEVNMGGIAYLLNYSLSFRPGFNHTINLTLNTSPDQEQIEISIDPGVNPWG